MLIPVKSKYRAEECLKIDWKPTVFSDIDVSIETGFGFTVNPEP